MRRHLLVVTEKKIKMLKTPFVIAQGEVLSLVHTCATRHDTTACDTTRFFAPHTVKWISSHDQVWSSRQRAATTKIALEAIFVVCRSDSIKKTAKENSFL